VTWIGGSQLIKACAERTGLPTLNRQLAPQLFEYNRQGAWNGHIPVTAVNSAILVFAAILTGANQVVFSNERSASYGSLILAPDGSITGEVNHQWSKGWAFERDFGDYVHARIATDLHYYSLLRPLSELAVARQFAKSDHYDAHFSSCNRNFHILGERPVNRWCGVCPKCHFVFLALAPFMPKPRLVGIFGRNLLGRPPVTTRCSNSRTTSPSNAWARAGSRAPRWPRSPSARNGARTTSSNASRARSGRSWMRPNSMSTR